MEQQKSRPREFRIGVLSRQARTVRVIGVVMTYLHTTGHRFVQAQPNELLDIAIVDHEDEQMRELLQQAMTRHPALMVVHLVSQPGQSGSDYELLPAQIMSALVPLLQRVGDALVLRTQAPVPAASSAGPHPAPAGAGGAAGQAAIRALVVDDSPTVRTQLASILERMGLRCDTAENATAALQQLSKGSYDILFVDVVMPDMDGYRLTREIKHDPAHKATPVIILTSQSSPFDRVRGALAGCDHFLTKPVTLNTLFETVNKALRHFMAVEGSLPLHPLTPAAPAPRASSPHPA